MFRSDDPLNFINNTGVNINAQTDLVQGLLFEINRVRALIDYYNSIPNGAGNVGSSILHELVAEAYNSLVNYDIELMRKYYDLLQNCD
jgi:hypothetical protein